MNAPIALEQAVVGNLRRDARLFAACGDDEVALKYRCTEQLICPHRIHGVMTHDSPPQAASRTASTMVQEIST